jgi:hypothetical protein
MSELTKQYFQIVAFIPVVSYWGKMYNQTSIPWTSYYVTFTITFASSLPFKLQAILLFQVSDTPLNYKCVDVQPIHNKTATPESALTISQSTSRY